MAKPLVPATQCTATSKASRERCRRLAIRGGTVCWSHGGAIGHVKRKAAERVALAEQLAAAPRQHPAQTILDAAHVADVMARAASTEDELLVRLDLSVRLAKMALEAGASELVRVTADAEVRATVTAIRGAQVDAGLTQDQRALFDASLARRLTEWDQRQRSKLKTALPPGALP